MFLYDNEMIRNLTEHHEKEVMISKIHFMVRIKLFIYKYLNKELKNYQKKVQIKIKNKRITNRNIVNIKLE